MQNKKTLIYSGLIFALLQSPSVVLAQDANGCMSRPTPTSHLTVASYNVENLFDAEHDAGKNDWEFLPKGYPGRNDGCRATARNSYELTRCFALDWTAAKVDLKIRQIRRALESVAPDGVAILGLAEVENPRVVASLARATCMGGWAVTESPDERGVDVAILYQESNALRFVSKVEHEIPREVLMRPTRNILQVNFNLRGQNLAVFMNHWPSQAAPSSVRVAVARFLADRIRSATQRDPSLRVLVMGDFNTTAEDRPDPFADVLMLAAPNGLALKDAHQVWAEDLESRGRGRDVQKAPPGTYFFAREMSFNRLDRFFYNEVATTAARPDPTTYRIGATDLISKSYVFRSPHYLNGSEVRGIPWGYDHAADSEDKAGFSDHFPILIDLIL